MRFFVTLVSAVVILGCGGGDTPSDVPSESSGVDREISGFSLTETNQGQRMWTLNAARAYRVPNDPKLSLDDVELIFFKEDGSEDSRLTSDRGFVNEDTGDLTAQNNVVLISVEGDTLTTDELSYSKETNLISGPEYVRLAKPDKVLTGIGFESKPDLSDYKVLRDVHVTIIDRAGNTPPGF